MWEFGESVGLGLFVCVSCCICMGWGFLDQGRRGRREDGEGRRRDASARDLDLRAHRDRSPQGATGIESSVSLVKDRVHQLGHLETTRAGRVSPRDLLRSQRRGPEDLYGFQPTLLHPSQILSTSRRKEVSMSSVSSHQDRRVSLPPSLVFPRRPSLSLPPLSSHITPKPYSHYSPPPPH